MDNRDGLPSITDQQRAGSLEYTLFAFLGFEPGSSTQADWMDGANAELLAWAARNSLSVVECVAAGGSPASVAVPRVSKTPVPTAPLRSSQCPHAIVAGSVEPTILAPAGSPRVFRTLACSDIPPSPQSTQPPHDNMGGCVAHTSTVGSVAPPSAVPVSAATLHSEVTRNAAHPLNQFKAPSNSRLGAVVERPPLGRKSATKKRRRHRIRDGFKQLEKAIPALWLRQKCPSNLAFRSDLASLLHAAVEFIQELEVQKAQLAQFFIENQITCKCWHAEMNA